MYDYRWVQTLDSLSSFFWGLVPIDLAGLVYILLASVQDFVRIVFGVVLAAGVILALFANPEGD